MNGDLSPFLASTAILDCNHPKVRDFATEIIGRTKDPVEMAVKLYLAVRDNILYDPYAPFHLPEHYRASFVLERGKSYCVPKASLLCALGRACALPSRVGFADVRNHLATKQLIDFIGGDLFVYHGFVEFYLEGKWVKATPAFNRDLCRRHNVPALEFNGREDSLFQAYNLDRHKFMEYVKFYGVYEDIPVEEIVAAWRKAYGQDRVNQWIATFEKGGGRSIRNFDREDVLKE